MATIKKTLSTKADANGFAQVLFYIVKGRNGRMRAKSGIFVPVANWNQKKQDLTIPQKIDEIARKELRDIKERLDITERRVLKLIEIYGDDATKNFVENVIAILKDYDGSISEEIVNNAIKLQKEGEIEIERKEEESKKRLFEHCEAFITKGYSDSRIRLFRVLFRSMARYELFRTKIALRPFDWNIDTTTQNDIEDFFDYLSKEHLYRVKYEKIYKTKVIYNEENKPKHKEIKIEARGENRMVEMRKCTKTFWNWLLKTKRTTNNPFYGVEIGVEKYGTPYFLTIEERNHIAEYDFTYNMHLRTQRDIFVFHCLIGCRVGDLTRFTPDNIVNGVLIYTPHKTKDENGSFVARVPLSEKALALINKYKGVDKKGRLFPFIADQNYNDAIKAILTKCEITRKVNVRNPKTGENEMLPLNEIASSHMARRTFVGNAYKIVKDPNLIGRMSGHVEGSKAFARYRDIDDDMLKDVINAIQ